MESFAFCTMPLLAFSHSLKIPHRLYLRRLLVPPNPGLFTAGRARCFGSLHPNRPREIFLISLAGSLLRTSSLGSPVNRGLACISSSTGSSGPNGGGNDGTGRWDGDGGGDGGFRGSSAQSFSIGEESVEASSRVPDVIILDVGGMTCGGCAASVKRILESQPQVSSASVNLATETAIVWAIPETKVMPNWKQQLGVRLAGNLTTCGFKSSFRDSDRVNVYKVFERKMDEKLQKLKQSGRELAVSWALCAVCLLGHVSHIFKAGPSWLQTCHSTSFHMSLSLFTFFGPGRKLVLDGFRSLFMGSPNMNTLVGLGALSSFAVSTIAALIPKLGWKTFFEEPIMLIAFVLLGKNLEQRAKIKATSDMTGLLNILPAKARLMIHTDAREVPSTVEVPCSDLHIGDQVVVLPGDRVPADGIVKAGRSTVDESSFTGEPLPVTKLPGAEVTAGSINLNGTLTIGVRRPGGETAMGDIVRLVENAQTREAPVQRLADKCLSGARSGGTQCSDMVVRRADAPSAENGAPCALVVRGADTPSAVTWWCAKRTHPVQKTGAPSALVVRRGGAPSAVPWWCAERTHPVQKTEPPSAENGGTQCLGGAQSGRTQCSATVVRRADAPSAGNGGTQCLGGAQSGRTQCRKRRHPVPWWCAERTHPVQCHVGAQSGRTQCRKRRHPVPWWCAERRHPVQCLGGAQSGRTQCLGGAQSGGTQCSAMVVCRADENLWLNTHGQEAEYGSEPGFYGKLEGSPELNYSKPFGNNSVVAEFTKGAKENTVSSIAASKRNIAAKTNFDEALISTEEISSPAIGFICVKEATNKDINRQNNTIIDLLLRINFKLDQLLAKSVPTNTEQILSLTKQLEGLTLGKPKKKEPFYVYQDPLVIYKKEKEKLNGDSK
ncbi:hypothetical protein ZIOFF_060938 [Zingiber officinale]|uniref:HMA domain-containing protein n=1 Tax=Zingiber officinale TaxID=94328 RepID=A0A8J5KPC4_ZINOF|nr:hypothetical protein ZIOFF_060938 [Zingiber officinale]